VPDNWSNGFWGDTDGDRKMTDWDGALGDAGMIIGMRRLRVQ